MSSSPSTPQLWASCGLPVTASGRLCVPSVWQVRRPSKLSFPPPWPGKILYLHKNARIAPYFLWPNTLEGTWGDPASIVWTALPTSAWASQPVCRWQIKWLLPSQRAQPSCRAPRLDRNMGIGRSRSSWILLGLVTVPPSWSSQEIRLRASHYLQRRSCSCLLCEWWRTHHPVNKW